MEALPRPGSRGYRSRRLASEWPPRGLHSVPGPVPGLAAPCPAASGPLLPAPGSPRPAEERRAFPPAQQLGGQQRFLPRLALPARLPRASCAARLGLPLPPTRSRSRGPPRPCSISPPPSPQSGGLLSLPESLKVRWSFLRFPRGPVASPEGGERWKRCPVHFSSLWRRELSRLLHSLSGAVNLTFQVTRQVYRCISSLLPSNLLLTVSAPRCCQFCKALRTVLFTRLNLTPWDYRGKAVFVPFRPRNRVR